MTALPTTLKQLRLPLAPAAAPAPLVRVGLAASSAEGQLAYDAATTPPSLARILDAQATAKVRDTSDRDLDQLLIGELENAARRLGHRNAATDGLDVNLMQRDLAQLLRLRWGYLTVGEVRQVFLLGSMRQLPALGKDGQPDHSEVVFLSSATVGTWLTRYKYQVKPEAMAHAQRLAPESCELPYHHPVLARWRIARLTELAGQGVKLTRADAAELADPANLLYLWLREIGAPFQVRPTEYWRRMKAREAYRLGQRQRVSFDRDERRAGNAFLGLIRQSLPSQGKLSDRVLAACRWRTLCEWLLAHCAKGTDLPALLWPLALAAYTPPAA